MTVELWPMIQPLPKLLERLISAVLVAVKVLLDNKMSLPGVWNVAPLMAIADTAYACQLSTGAQNGQYHGLVRLSRSTDTFVPHIIPNQDE
jgi:hypothetical protein